MNVILEIDTLILDGLGPVDGPAVRAAVEQELAGLLREGGLPAYGGLPDVADAPDAVRLASPSVSIRVQPPFASASLGAQVARAIYSSLQP